ncbi:MAG: UDP-N-acetylmuramate dehydrogenase [Synergistaceae bacterium]|nr:UDP-N-acetylmuramate dehydrogenase [Synergistaceae bacterium]
MDLRELLSRNLSCPIEENVSLAKYCTFGTGGKAKYLISPYSALDVVRIMNAREQYHFPLFFLGNGSNVLLSDIEGVVILSSGFNYADYYECKEKNKVIIEVGSGHLLKSVVKESIRRGYKGFEFAVGIPGTVGGAVVGNAGAQGIDVSRLLLWVECVTTDGAVIRMDSNDIVSGYRYSSLSESGCFITKCAFEAASGDVRLIKEKCLEYWSKRSHQPYAYKNAGCIFKNTSNYSAGRLLDECGCKGKRIGDAEISSLHANFCVNLGNARVADIKKLIYECRDIVYEKKGILLDFEVKIFGF